jgi:hypothetical protein
MKTILSMLLCAAIMTVSSVAPASAWYAHRGYYAAPYYYHPYARHYDDGAAGAALALGIFGLAAGAAIAASQPPVYAPYSYYNSPAYQFSPGPCPQWWDGYQWNYSCN